MVKLQIAPMSLLRENVRRNCSGKMSAYLRNEDSSLEPETAKRGGDPDQIEGTGSGRWYGGGAVGSESPPGAPAPCPLSPRGLRGRSPWQCGPRPSQSHRPGPGGADPGLGGPQGQV